MLYHGHIAELAWMVGHVLQVDLKFCSTSWLKMTHMFVACQVFFFLPPLGVREWWYFFFSSAQLGTPLRPDSSEPIFFIGWELHRHIPRSRSSLSTSQECQGFSAGRRGWICCKWQILAVLEQPFAWNMRRGLLGATPKSSIAMFFSS